MSLSNRSSIRAGQTFGLPPTRRDPVIDIFRAWAIVGMVTWHAVMWFVRDKCHVSHCEPLFSQIWHLIFYNGSLLSVPVFYFAAGLNLARNISRRRRKRAALRALQLIMLGYGLTFYVMGPDKWLHAYVLQSIGVGLLVMLALSWWRSGPVAAIAASYIATLYNDPGPGVLIPSFAAHESAWPVLFDGLSALMVTGGFATIPWMGFIALGIVVSSIPPRLHVRMAVISIAALPVGLALGVEKYPMSPGYLTFFASLLTLLYIALNRLRAPLSQWMAAAPIGRGFTQLSRHSLEIFIIHYLIGHTLWLVFPELRGGLIVALFAGLMFLAIAAALPDRLARHSHAPEPET